MLGDYLSEFMHKFAQEVAQYEEKLLFDLLSKHGITNITKLYAYYDAGRIKVEDYGPRNKDSSYVNGYSITIDNKIVLQMYFKRDYEYDIDGYYAKCAIKPVIDYYLSVNEKEE